MSANGTATLAPYSQEAEEGVIGAVLIAPEWWPILTDIVRAGDFFIVRHGIIWAALARLAARGDAVDFITVQSELAAMGKLTEIGGPAYLLNLINNTPTSQNADTYAMLVQRGAVRRRLMLVSDQMKQLAQAEHMNVEQVLEEAEASFNQVLDSFADKSAESNMSEMVDAMLNELESMLDGEHVSAMPTGFKVLDDLLAGGVRRGELITVAGRPGMGKTALMLNIAKNAARVGVRVGVHSIEMDRQQLVRRIASAEAGVNLKRFRDGKMTRQEYQKVLAVSSALAPLPLYTNDSSMQSPERVYAQARRWQARHGLDLIVLDYLQLLDATKKFKGNDSGAREQQISYFMRSLKAIARKLNVPIIIGAQLNREVDKRQDKRPMLSDLRESGSIEQDSDIVGLLFWEAYPAYGITNADPNALEVIVAKNRNGETGTVKLHYDRPTQRISDGITRQIDLGSVG
jgi:replicative DNA helicase